MDVTRMYHELEDHNHVFEYVTSLSNEMQELETELADFDFHGVSSRLQNRLFTTLAKFREAVADVERVARENSTRHDDQLHGRH